jgi:kynurenine 3-monooxygenase
MAKKIIIVGSGLVGSALACVLARRGHNVTIYEKRSDMRKAGYVGGRSINLALSNRGWAMLDMIGMREEIEKITLPMMGRQAHNVDGSSAYIKYGKEGQAIYSVSRGDLNIAMINKAEKTPNIKFVFDEACTNINFDTNTVEFTNTHTHAVTHATADYVFGADGAFTAIRYEMQKTPQFNFSQTYEEYGYKELTIPALPGGGWALENKALHIWPSPDHSFMMIALPNMDGSFTCTLFTSHKGDNSFDKLKTEDEVDVFFQKNFPTAYKHLPDLKKDFFVNPVGALVTMRCFPWVYKNTALIGDAAHAVVPFYGQGMNCGFEDVCVLDQILTETNENWQEALDKYQYSRKPNADAIAAMAINNYKDMRRSGEPEFQVRKKIDGLIASKFPDKYSTEYSMVTFDMVPYSHAKQRSDQQNQLLDEIMRLDKIAERWDSDIVLTMAADWIKKNR